MERRVPGTPYMMHIARLGFVLLCMFMGGAVSGGYDRPWWEGSMGGALFAGFWVLVEFSVRELTLRKFSHATIGLLVGLLGAWLITRIGFFRVKGLEGLSGAQSVFELMVFLGLGFLGMMLALRSNREEFSLLIPYVRLRQDSAREQQIVAAPEILADGRVSRLFGCGFLTGELVVPRFVLEELQHWEASEQRGEKVRGRRGLECLEQMKSSSRVTVTLHEDPVSEENELGAKLIAVARMWDARLFTNDADLAKVARIHNVHTLLLNDLLEALRLTLREGDEVTLQLVKEGKDPNQAVGYLPDGTMIVVNDGKKHIGTSQDVVVSGAVKTGAGRLVFAELKR
jgi:uncharacterized protein YacL